MQSSLMPSSDGFLWFCHCAFLVLLFIESIKIGEYKINKACGRMCYFSTIFWTKEKEKWCFILYMCRRIEPCVLMDILAEHYSYIDFFFTLFLVQYFFLLLSYFSSPVFLKLMCNKIGVNIQVYLETTIDWAPFPQPSLLGSFILPKGTNKIRLMEQSDWKSVLAWYDFRPATLHIPAHRITSALVFHFAVCFRECIHSLEIIGTKYFVFETRVSKVSCWKSFWAGAAHWDTTECRDFFNCDAKGPSFFSSWQNNMGHSHGNGFSGMQNAKGSWRLPSRFLKKKKNTLEARQCVPGLIFYIESFNGYLWSYEGDCHIAMGNQGWWICQEHRMSAKGSCRYPVEMAK